MTGTAQGVHFSRRDIVYLLLSGVSWRRSPRPTVIKSCITVILESVLGSPISVVCRGCYHLCCGANRNIALPSGSVWLRVKSGGIAVGPGVVSLWSNCDHFVVPITHTRKDDGSDSSVNFLVERSVFYLGYFLLTDWFKLSPIPVTHTETS